MPDNCELRFLKLYSWYSSPVKKKKHACMYIYICICIHRRRGKIIIATTKLCIYHWYTFTANIVCVHYLETLDRITFQVKKEMAYELFFKKSVPRSSTKRTKKSMHKVRNVILILDPNRMTKLDSIPNYIYIFSQLRIV